MTRSNELDDSEVGGPISVEDTPWREWGRGRFMGRVRHLTRRVGRPYRVGVLIEELQPGKQSCPAHYHLHEEEHVWMLEGVATLRLGDKRYPMKPGDYVCFPAGQREGHCLVNESDQPCRYLVIGENNPNEVAVYTDSNKIMVRARGRHALPDARTHTGLVHSHTRPRDCRAECAVRVKGLTRSRNRE